MTITTPIATTTFLPRADGSTMFSHGTTTIIASVTGPMEVRPRDELPQSAFIEVLVRPSVGVAGTRERYLEQKLAQAVSPMIHASYHPRTLIQLNIQIMQSEKGQGNGEFLAPCINAATLALIDAGCPLKGLLVATTVRFDENGNLVTKNEGRGRSSHVLAFDSKEGLVFVESQGCFDEEGFRRAVIQGRWECIIDPEEGEDVSMEETFRIGKVVRETVHKKIIADMRWSK